MARVSVGKVADIPQGKIVTCPLHGSQWDVTSGSLVWFMRPLPNEPVYKVVVEGGEVFVEK
jgi:nitrite reductase/ring-hydroxylating ferredoxin subunit